MKRAICIVLVFVLAKVEAQQNYPITFTHDDKTVFGTFSTPDGPGRFPTIIINPGSGPSDRDGTLLLEGGNIPCLYPELNGETLKYYKELAEALVDSGFAVLRYDKLEYTYSANLGTITFHKLWLPVESAIEYVKSRSDVDTNQLILIGHSEGSSLIPFIAKERNDIKALISIAGAKTPFDSILANQLVLFAQICDGDTALAQQQASQILNYFWNVRVGNCNLLPSLFGVSGCVWRDYFDATDPVAENYNFNNLPTLFIGLELDINVPPSELIRFQNEVTITDDFWTIPGLIHFMTPANDPHVSQMLSDTIVYWLRENNFTTGSEDINLLTHSVNIHPNPFSDIVHIAFEASMTENVYLSIYDIYGQLILSKQIDSHESGASINLEFLPDGMYLINLTTGNRETTMKIVKG